MMDVFYLDEVGFINNDLVKNDLEGRFCNIVVVVIVFGFF